MSKHFIGKVYDLTQNNMQKIIEELEDNQAEIKILKNYIDKCKQKRYEQEYRIKHLEQVIDDLTKLGDINE